MGGALLKGNFRNFQTETVLLSVAVPSLLFRLQESPRAQSFLKQITQDFVSKLSQLPKIQNNYKPLEYGLLRNSTMGRNQ